MDATEAVAAWGEFCDLLKEAGAVLARDDLGLDAFDRGEGLRYLARVAQNSLTGLENPGPRHPRVRVLPEHCGFGLDNPDNEYSSFLVDARYDYRISGTRGTIAYLSFAAQNQNYAHRDRLTGGSGHLNAGELDVDADGRFEVIASTTPKPGNWLEMAEDTSMILIRQTFADRSIERAAHVVPECLDAIGEPAPALRPEVVPHALLTAAMTTIGASAWFADWVAPWRVVPNTLHFPDPEHHRLVGGDPNIVFQLGYWSLAPDQMLVVRATPPRCQYWNFQLGNIWAECLDKRRCISHNIASTTYAADGSFELVVAHEDPGHPNWVDTAGHAHGIMGLRWVLAETLPPATCEVVPMAK